MRRSRRPPPPTKTARGPAVASASADLSTLRWREEAPRLRVAPVPGGRYILVADPLAQWTAQWRPDGGKVTYLVLRTSAQLAADACTRHFIEQRTDALLVRSGAAELAQPDVAGPATTWKHRR